MGGCRIVCPCTAAAPAGHCMPITPACDHALLLNQPSSPGCSVVYERSAVVTCLRQLNFLQLPQTCLVRCISCLQRGVRAGCGGAVLPRAAAAAEWARNHHGGCARHLVAFGVSRGLCTWGDFGHGRGDCAVIMAGARCTVCLCCFIIMVSIELPSPGHHHHGGCALHCLPVLGLDLLSKHVASQ